jgi:hypothetical protein
MVVNLPSTFSSELLEPTRTLRSASEAPGQLSVFSEPPELPVRMDGREIGVTPIVGFKVEAGVHELTVTGVTKEIYILPGQSLKLSLHKNTFIEIPETSETVSKTAERQKAPAREEKVEAAARTKDKELQPLYWPLNPKGPIY